MQIRDCLTLDASGLSRSSDGFLVATAKVARAGNVQGYLGSEIGLTGDDADKAFGVYRDPDVVFDEASMASLAGRPVTRNHPPEGVNAKTWRDLAVGTVGGRIVRDGEHVVASMAIMDAAAADEVEAGARSLSAGYTANIVKDSGFAPDGTPYQYRQAGPIRFNHVAYLPDNNPRAGNTRIGDGAGQWGISAPITLSTKEDAMSDALKTVVLGDDAAQVAAADAAKVENFKADMAKKLSDAIATRDAEIATLTKDGETKDGKIAALEKALADATSPAAIADAAKKRADAMAAGKKAGYSEEEMAAMDDAAIRRAVVTKSLGDGAKELTDAGIDGAFAALRVQVKVGDEALGAGIVSQVADAWAAFTPKKEG